MPKENGNISQDEEMNKATQEEEIDYGDEVLSWQVPEYEKMDRSKVWYIVAIAIAFLFLTIAMITGNYLFAVIIILITLVTILHHGQEPIKVTVSLTDEGVFVGKKFYDYDKFKNFTVIYKPSQEVRNLYFEFKNALRYRIIIPLDNSDPLIVRETLLKFVPEDLERTDVPISEGIARIFKL